jgi:hypothetical protein
MFSLIFETVSKAVFETVSLAGVLFEPLFDCSIFGKTFQAAVAEPKSAAVPVNFQPETVLVTDSAATMFEPFFDRLMFETVLLSFLSKSTMFEETVLAAVLEAAVLVSF